MSCLRRRFGVYVPIFGIVIEIDEKHRECFEQLRLKKVSLGKE